ncbi:hypothetical protein GGI25_001277 [Coemansia spiralis]|uniref:CAP-Gly domain-containing protein n=2 Tax=Coemansia TaxID=4863 RepID=A0A9W8L0B2_9FUNG|nr:CAP Gly-rich domain-containing protein [Coemansia spiralis]KAJ1994975.1 hypothetical protein EDC05_001351 [Coemansia umbellata]KAJ2624587.1 hypothetical protein GGI26_001280 [Coemansia sp. RSA 1358]KAJ2679825.1 hypothetical protein GGI25_001277 [Coemansia spiralis]
MSVVTLFVESENARSERRFQKSVTIDDLKTRLEPIVGIPANDQRIVILQGTAVVGEITDGTKMLGYYPVEDYMSLRVTSTNPSGTQVNFNDESQVEKYVMDDDEYDKRTDSVRAFKRRHNMGRFADAKSAMSIDEEDEFKVEAATISVGNRCEVAVVGSTDFARRGTVRFVGKTSFRPGYWVGIEYDEPVGKNGGTVDGVEYFKCAFQHGSFVRPDKVTVGDFPEENLFDSDLEEM